MPANGEKQVIFLASILIEPEIRLFQIIFLIKMIF